MSDNKEDYLDKLIQLAQYVESKITGVPHPYEIRPLDASGQVSNQESDPEYIKDKNV